MISFNEATKAASRGETLFQNCFCWAWHLSNSTVPVNTCLHGSLAIDCIKLHQFKVFSWKLWGLTVMEMHRWIPHLCLNFSLVTRLWWWDFLWSSLEQTELWVYHPRPPAWAHSDSEIFISLCYKYSPSFGRWQKSSLWVRDEFLPQAEIF